MDDQIAELFISITRTERSRFALPADKKLSQVRDGFAQGNALGHGRYPMLLDEASAAEYERRAQAWLDLAKRLATELGVEWTTDRSRLALHTIQSALAQDWEDIHSRLERFAKGSRGMRIDMLNAAKDRADRHLEQELALLVMKSDRTRIPVVERLLADRYQAVRISWTKANGLLDGANVDLAGAAREAVAAVEALGRTVIGDSSATLGDVIKNLRNSKRVRAPLLKGIEELWVWANGEPGVRHGALNAPLVAGEVRYCMRLAEGALSLLLAADSGTEH